MGSFIAGLVNTNLPAFVVIKLTVTVTAAAVFIFAQKSLLKLPNHESKSFLNAQKTLRIIYIGIVLFLVTVVVNNILVILRML
jgi:membrane protein DedA with SNARE-associated domain